MSANEDQFRSLCDAASSGDLGLVQSLLRKGVNPDSNADEFIDSDWSPLALAASSGHVEIVRVLLDNKADVDYESGFGSALQNACTLGKLEVVKLLLERGANVNLPTDNPPLSLACRKGHTEIATLLLDRGADFNIPTKSDPLFWAIRGGYKEVVKLLLVRGVDPNVIQGKYTPLIIAAEELHLDIAKLLLEHGSHVHQAVSTGYTPMWCAILKESAALLKLLLDFGLNPDSELEAYKVTILHAAAGRGMVEIVKLLLDKGADVSKLTDIGSSPIHTATQGKHFDVVKLLVPKAATLDPVGCRIALIDCLHAGRMDVVEDMIRARSEIAKEAPRAIILAAKYKGEEGFKIMKLMIDNGSLLNWVDRVGGQTTALHEAVLNKEVNKVWELVLHGASTSIAYEKAGTSTSVWQLCDDKDIRQALLHFWTPQTHKLHPKWVRDAILCVLLVAKRQSWPLDQLLMRKLMSHVAYGWYNPGCTSPG